MKRTKEVSKLVGVSRRTLQYYDDEGLLLANRSEDNYRLYDEKTLERIWEILIYKEMGFKLEEIKCLLQFPEHQREAYLEQKTEVIREEIEQLKEQEKFVTLIKDNGMPLVPAEGSKVTYREAIEELKERMKKGYMEGKLYEN